MVNPSSYLYFRIYGNPKFYIRLYSKAYFILSFSDYNMVNIKIIDCIVKFSFNITHF